MIPEVMPGRKDNRLISYLTHQIWEMKGCHTYTSSSSEEVSESVLLSVNPLVLSESGVFGRFGAGFEADDLAGLSVPDFRVGFSSGRLSLYKASGEQIRGAAGTSRYVPLLSIPGDLRFCIRGG